MSQSSVRDVVIIGSGPAGLTAAIYTARANLHPLVFEGIQAGGQLTITSEVENFPGFPGGISGPELMENLRKQAERFGAELRLRSIIKVDLSKRPFTLTDDDGKATLTRTLIVATGAAAQYLGLESERRFMNRGVSACATCDGFFFRGKRVAVVGGGDTAMEDGNYLTHFASHVTIIHRRDEFRASRIMQEKARSNPKISFELSKVVDEVLGTDTDGVTGLRLRDVKTGATSEIKIDGLFVAIGHHPNTEVFEGQLPVDAQGYLITEGKTTETGVHGVFACGDVQDARYRQAISAAGSGCMAAIDVERLLQIEE